MTTSARVLLAAACASALLPCRIVASPARTTITIDPSQRHQVMTGWEAVAEVGDIDYIESFETWRDAALDAAADLNINRLRLKVSSGAENPVDHFARYKKGLIRLDAYFKERFVAVNDNTNSDVIDPSGFHFSEIDHRIDNVVMPLRKRLAARGERLHVMLQFQDATHRKPNGFEHSKIPAEYAEFMLAAAQHIRGKYGWVPDSYSMQNEPNNRGFWNAAKLGKALVATGNRLVAAGFPKPAIVAPDCSNVRSAIRFFDDLINTQGVTRYLTDFSYHRYGSTAGTDLQAIAARAGKHGLRTAMLEHIGSGHEHLHADLTVGNVSSWEQYTVAYPCKGQCDGEKGGSYFAIDTADPRKPRVVMGRRTKFLAQYFRYVRLGAVRIGAQSDNPGFDPVAFRNPDGTHVVVVKATEGGDFSIRGLPAGTYGIRHTAPKASDVAHPDVAIGPGQAVRASVPRNGVLTAYGAALRGS